METRLCESVRCSVLPGQKRRMLASIGSARRLGCLGGLLLVPLSIISAFAQGQPQILWSRTAHNGKISAVPFSPSGQMLASGGGDATVKLWRASDGALIRTLRQPFGGVNAASFSPDGSRLAVGTSAFNQNLNIWRVADGSPLFSRITAHLNGTQAVAYSPDGLALATGGRDRTTKIWRAADMALLKTFNDSSRVFSLAYTADGKLVASGCQGTVHIWRVVDGALQKNINANTTYVFALALSPDGTTVAATSGNGISLWSVATGALIRNFSTTNNGSVTSLVFSRDGQILLSGSDVLVYPDESGVIRFWRVSDGALLKTYDAQTGPAGVVLAYSPDATVFSYGRYDGILAVAQNPF